jgi:hypothetical protein
MAVNAILCTDKSTTSVDFVGLPISVGQFITASDAPQASNVINYCVQITDVDIPGGILTATTDSYTSCYDCLINNYTKARLNPCSSDYPYSPPLFDISDFGYILVPGQTFNLEFTIEGRSGTETFSGCFEVEGTFQLSEDEYISLLAEQVATLSQIFFYNYTTCDECLNGFSTGTESTICVICCPCTTGETVTSVVPPHPIWTNGQGQAITQLNAITLGGPNGLNS